MKKVVSILLLYVLLITLSACQKSKEEKAEDVLSSNEQTSIGLPSPMSELTSLEELNNECSTRIVKPGVMGIGDEKFFKITSGDDVIADYRFSIAGKEFSIRNGAVVDDISGYYIDGKPAFEEVVDGMDFKEDDEVYLARFFNIEGQFVVSMKKSEDVDFDYFKMVCEEIEAVNSFSNATE